MSKIPDAQYDALEQQINESLQKAGRFKDKLRRTSLRYTITNILFSALATFVAGRAVLFPATVGNWRLTCTVAGTFALGATIVAGLQRHLADPEILAEACECYGRLKNLKVQIIGRQYDWEKIKSEYGKILEANSRVEC
ncbi:MAG TPA: hypothetical protein VGJ66_06665 [Pyrinomonadaceae bacterium]|jgi:hypothetical protein